MLCYRAVGAACVFVTALVTAIGCKKASGPVGPQSAIPVPVSHPVERDVTEFVEYTGRLDAVRSVGVKARATGYLKEIGPGVREGAQVEKDQVLFVIDPEPYEVQLEQARKQVEVSKAQFAGAQKQAEAAAAQVKLDQANAERARSGSKTGVVSQQELDQAKAAVDVSQAREAAAKAAITEADARAKAAQSTADTYALNLSYTRVKSPIRGQLSRFYFTEGNLIAQDQTLLTTVVSIDQIYAYFDMDERTLQRINAQVIAGRIKPPASGATVFLGLGGESDFPYRGRIDFLNNVVNPSTGTVSVRGVFDNPLSPNGARVFAPGMFVRIRLPIGEPRRSVLVVDRAIGSDQGLKYVYVVGSDNKLVYRRVSTGPLQDDGLRALDPYQKDPKTGAATGVRPDEWVVVGSLPQLRAGAEVQPEQVPMPTPGGPLPGADAPPARGPDGAPKRPPQPPAPVTGK